MRLDRRQALARLAGFLAGSPLLHSQFVPRGSHRRVPPLDELASVFEFEPVARAKMTQAAYDFVAGGVENEFSLRRNREAFNWVSLIPRAMADVSSVDLRTEVLGRPMDSPILICPTAAHQLLHPDGELETHRGATAAGVTMIVSAAASYTVGMIAEAAEGPLWYQLYVHRDPERARERIDQAAEAGCQAVCWTVDAQYSSQRERLLHDRHLRTSVPGARAEDDAREATRRRRERRRGVTELPPNPYGARQESPDQDWPFLKTLRGWTGLPIVVKGILTAEDAKLAVEHGADAVVVSNHGARYLADVTSTMEALPEIVDAVGGRIPVLMDGGIRRGSDALKALSLGATAVGLGRAPLWGLGAFGAAGVRRVLEILQAELALAMAHIGCSRISELSRSFVRAEFP